MSIGILQDWNGAYEETISIASTSWVINHGLNTTAPVVDVWVLQGSPQTYQRMLPVSVVATSASSLTITFSEATSGKVVVV